MTLLGKHHAIKKTSHKIQLIGISSNDWCDFFQYSLSIHDILVSKVILVLGFECWATSTSMLISLTNPREMTSARHWRIINHIESKDTMQLIIYLFDGAVTQHSLPKEYDNQIIILLYFFQYLRRTYRWLLVFSVKESITSFRL